MRELRLTSVITAAYLTIACATVNGPTAPTPVDSGSGAPRESQPMPPQAPPPSADRGSVPPTEPPTVSACNAANAQWAVGERESPELLERARVAAQAKTARFLRPNEIITMEYSSSRLNLHLGTDAVVGSVRCG